MITKKTGLPLLLLTLLLLSACQKVQVPFAYPKEEVTIIGNNGVVIQNDKIWFADLLDGQIIGADKSTGKIFATYTKKMLKAAPDDLCFIDEENFVWTSPGDGRVSKTNIDGTTVVLAFVGAYVNPVAKIPNEHAVAVSFSVGDKTAILKINTDNGKVDTLVKDIVPMNGFDISSSNKVYAPTSDLNSILGQGKLLMADLNAGTFSVIGLHFPAEPSRAGLSFPTGVALGPDGSVYMLQSLPPVSVYKVDPLSGTATKLASVTNPVGDNIFVNGDGKVYVSTFVGNQIVEIDQSGNQRTISIHN